MKHLLFLTLFIAASCSDGVKPYVSAYPVVVTGDSCVTLYAGQHIDVGTVCSEVDGQDLVFTYNVVPEWFIEEAHLWVDTTLMTLPVTNSGNPRIGHFPYASGPLVNTTTYEFRIPLMEFGLTGYEEECNPLELFAVAHASVFRELDDGTIQQETAFGDGERLVPKGSWATWFTYTLECEGEEPPPVGDSCETAFATGLESTCFLESPYNFLRWGWTSGSFGPGSYRFELYAGAAKCDLSKGELVGHVTLEYDGNEAIVSYKVLPGYYLDETHLYIGNDPLPYDKQGNFTVAPGLYPYQHDLTTAGTDQYIISGLSGQLYIVAHAVSCSFPHLSPEGY